MDWEVALRFQILKGLNGFVRKEVSARPLLVVLTALDECDIEGPKLLTDGLEVSVVA